MLAKSGTSGVKSESFKSITERMASVNGGWPTLASFRPLTCRPAAVIDGSLIISLISEPNYPTRLRVSRRYRPLDQQGDGQREGGQSLKHN